MLKNNIIRLERHESECAHNIVLMQKCFKYTPNAYKNCYFVSACAAQAQRIVHVSNFICVL